MSDGELRPSHPRRPQARRTDAPSARPSRIRFLVPALLCLSLLAAPLLLVGGSKPAVRLTAAKETAAPAFRASHGYGVPDGILTSADLAAATADGVTASGASDGSGTGGVGQAGPDSGPGQAVVMAHIASVSAPAPVSAGSDTAGSSGASAGGGATSPPATSPPPTTTPPTTSPPTTQAAASSGPDSETGSASWYQAPAGTCAHQTLPFGTVVTVTNLANGESTTCTVEDRGPYEGGRILDMSEYTFSQIASTSDGVIQVRISW